MTRLRLRLPPRAPINEIACCLALVAALLPATKAFAQTPHVEGVRIVERGIYDAETVGPVGPTSLKPVRNARLLRATTDIPAQLGLRFGFRYALQGSPLAAITPVEIVTRYPLPGIRRGSAAPVTDYRYTVPVGIGVPQYLEFQFDEAEELVSGIWIIEIWHSGRKLGTQRFCVSGPAGAALSPSCADELSAYDYPLPSREAQQGSATRRVRQLAPHSS